MKAIQESFDNIITIEGTNPLSNEESCKKGSMTATVSGTEKRSEECEILENNSENMNTLIGIFKEKKDSEDAFLLKEITEHVN